MSFQAKSATAAAQRVPADGGTPPGAASPLVNLAEVSDFPSVVSLLRGRPAAGLLSLVIVKQFARGVSSNGYALRLGPVDRHTRLVLVCMGYRTGRVLREASAREFPVYVTGGAELLHLTKMLRDLHRSAHILICADDDSNDDAARSGSARMVSSPQSSCRALARAASQSVRRCDFTWPVFDGAGRQPGDRSFSDLGVRQGLSAVARQLRIVVSALERSPAGAR